MYLKDLVKLSKEKSNKKYFLNNYLCNIVFGCQL